MIFIVKNIYIFKKNEKISNEYHHTEIKTYAKLFDIYYTHCEYKI